MITNIEEFMTTLDPRTRERKLSADQGFSEAEARALRSVLPNPGMIAFFAFITAEIDGKLVTLSTVRPSGADAAQEISYLQGEISGMRRVLGIVEEALNTKAET
jgi:hypothetical protein